MYLRLSQKLSALNSIEFSFFSIVKFVSNPRTTRIFEWNEKYGKAWTFHVINGLWSTRKNIIPFLISFFWKKKRMKLSITKEVDFLDSREQEIFTWDLTCKFNFCELFQIVPIARSIIDVVFANVYNKWLNRTRIFGSHYTIFSFFTTYILYLHCNVRFIS